MNTNLFADEVFRFLCQLTVVENFYKRTVNSTMHIEGTENHELLGCLIVRDVPGLMKYVKQEIIFTPIKGLNFKKKLLKEEYADGAYAIEYGRLSNKVFLHNFVNQVMRHKNIKRMEVLQERYVPSDFLSSGTAVAVDTPMIGSRTQVAITAGLLGGRGYLVKQTAYAGLPIGKVCLFTRTGLAREFFLKPEPHSLLKDAEYFDAKRKIVGVVRVYPADKRERKEYRILPGELGINPQKFLQKKSIISGFFERIPLLRSSVTAGLWR